MQTDKLSNCFLLKSSVARVCPVSIFIEHAEYTDQAPVMSSNAKQYLVVGLGASGLSCVRHLKSHGELVKVVDSRLNPPGLAELKTEWPEVEVALGDFSWNDFSVADEIILSPGVPLRTNEIQQAIAKGIACYGDIELFARLAKAPIIAVTGSNGKSTTVTLLTELLRADGKQVELGGNIGVPVLDLLKRPVPDYYVLELSSFQLETTLNLEALAVVVLNVSADHMDRYESLQAYSDSKTKIFAQAKQVIYSIDNLELAKKIPSAKQVVSYSMTAANADVTLQELADETWIRYQDENLLKLSSLKIAGRHNVENALAAIALASVANISKRAIVACLPKFVGLDHRTQWVLEKNGVRWYNDSKGTNIGATNAALLGLGQPVVLIAGGQAKGADFSELKPVVCKRTRAVVLIGEDANLIAESLDDCVSIAYADSMDEAVLKAAALAQAGDVVLLSPACASFDMFKNFMDRGDCFIDAVNRLIAK